MKQVRLCATMTLVALSSFIALPIAAQPEYRLLVSSRNSNSIIQFDGQSGEYLGAFSELASIVLPQEVALGPDNRIYLAARGNPTIMRFDRQSGAYLGEFSTGYDLAGATKMTFGPDGLLYLSQWGGTMSAAPSKVVRFNASTGAFVDEFTDIAINRACGHAWDADGILYVASFGDQDVKVFDHDGRFVTSLIGPNQLEGPVNLWFDSIGDLLVLDWSKAEVLRFDAQGAFKEVFINELSAGEGVAFGPDNMLYICDWAANNVKRFDPVSGKLIDIFAQGGGLGAPNSLVFIPNDLPSSAKNVQADNRNKTELRFFPNPAQSGTTIELKLPTATNVTLELIDSRGKIVKRIKGESSSAAGNHRLNWDGSGVAAGLYYVRLQTNAEQLMYPLVLRP